MNGVWAWIDAQPWEWLLEILALWFGASVLLGLVAGRVLGTCKPTSEERRCLREDDQCTP